MMLRPLRTSISIGLRVIPPSAGLNSATRHKLPPKATVGHHIQQQPSHYLTVTPDKDMEEEIAKFNRWS